MHDWIWMTLQVLTLAGYFVLDHIHRGTIRRQQGWIDTLTLALDRSETRRQEAVAAVHHMRAQWTPKT